MATAPTSPSPNDLTRQQLDELDALLQRMLSLPVAPPDPFAPPAAVPVPPLPDPAVTPAPAVALSVFAPPPAPVLPFPARDPAPPPAPPVSRRADPPAPPPPGPHLYAAPVMEIPRPPEPPAWKQPPAPAPLPMPTREVAEAPVAPPNRPTDPTPLPPAPEPETGGVLLAPLVLFNRGVNGALGLFGLPGRILRSGFVKNVLGFAGLGLLLYTGAKVAQLQGWILIPAQLPWPR